MPNSDLFRDQVYQEMRANVRATDEISFKLLGLLPLVTGVAFLAFSVNENTTKKPDLVVVVSLFAAIVTLGLLRWELRNIQNCKWFQLRCEAMEEQAGIVSSKEPP